MKFEAGRFIVKMTSHGIHDKYFFLKVWKDSSAKWWYRADDGHKKRIDSDTRDQILEEMHLVARIPDGTIPEFTKVRLTIEASCKQGGEYVWTKVSGEVFEKLLKTFPSMVDSFWRDENRRRKIRNYLSKSHHKPE